MEFTADELALEAHRWLFAVRERAETWHARLALSSDARALVAAFDAAAEILARPFDPPGWVPPLGADLGDPVTCAEARRWSHALRAAAERLREEACAPGARRTHALRLADTLDDVASLFRVRPGAGVASERIAR